MVTTAGTAHSPPRWALRVPSSVPIPGPLGEFLTAAPPTSASVFTEQTGTRFRLGSGFFLVFFLREVTEPQCPGGACWVGASSLTQAPTRPPAPACCPPGRRS